MNRKLDLLYFLLIFLITIISVFDVFTNAGLPATFDGLTHTTTIGLFYKGLQEGVFPLRWIDGFANYGMPLPIIAHQIPNYLGAFAAFIVGDPVAAINIVWFIGILLSNIFFYLFLRIYFQPHIAFLGTFLFNFAPYRIINFYIRGALPEAFSNVFLPLILLSLYYLIKKKKIFAFFLLSFSFAGLILTHPMTLIIYAFIFVPYVFFLLLEDSGKMHGKRLFSKSTFLFLISICIAGSLGLGIASYYIIPLLIEIKYFYYGLSYNHLMENQYMHLSNYIDPYWYYFTDNDIFTRGHIIKSGVLEIIGLVVGIVYVVYKYAIKQEKEISLLEFSIATAVVIIFFTSQYAGFIYTHFSALGNIQHPWRMMSAFMFLPPIIYASFVKKTNNMILLILLIIIVCVIRFPQLYGKNYINYPESMYYFTPYNLHATVMNTIWTGRTEDYPIKKEKAEVVSGIGTIQTLSRTNIKREYAIEAHSPVKLVDYTFYFPGWKVYVDGKEVPIQFQDPNYRGVITYELPQGQHAVRLQFEDTKVRSISTYFSIIAIALFLLGILFRKRIAYLVFHP